jgi:hypothetical protein
MLAALALLAFGQTTIDLKAIATVKHPPIGEMSGIVQSRTYPGVFWVHNDSGDSARIFPIKADGTLIKPTYETDFWVNTPEEGKKEWPGIKIVDAHNVDWEDIAIDRDILYVSDLGNNGNARRDLGVYVIPEPNPNATGETRSLKFLPIKYPDQTTFPSAVWHFDCEAIFVFKGKLHIITKHRKDGNFAVPEDSAKLYRLETAYTDKPNVLKKLDTREGLGGWVTAADLSPNGKTLAVLCNAPVASIWFFDLQRTGDGMLNAPSKRILLKNARQAEAICFENDKSVLVTNEQRDIFRVAAP